MDDELADELLCGQVKLAADTEISYAMAGKLYLSGSGWILMAVPNALGRGAFDALHELGVELPTQGDTDQYNAHVSVIRPEELAEKGLTPDDIDERGHTFRYTLGPLRSCAPSGWDEMNRVWFIEVHSPDLEKLRKSYGLTARPHDNDYEFHITVGVRRKSVLKPSEVSKIRLVPRDESIAEGPSGSSEQPVRKAAGLLATAAKLEAKTAAASSVYLDQAAVQPIHYSAEEGVLPAFNRYLSTVKTKGDQMIAQRQTRESWNNALSPDRGLANLQTTLAHPEPAVEANPIDRVLSRL